MNWPCKLINLQFDYHYCIFKIQHWLSIGRIIGKCQFCIISEISRLNINPSIHVTVVLHREALSQCSCQSEVKNEFNRLGSSQGKFPRLPPIEILIKYLYTDIGVPLQTSQFPLHQSIVITISSFKGQGSVSPLLAINLNLYATD